MNFLMNWAILSIACTSLAVLALLLWYRRMKRREKREAIKKAERENALVRRAQLSAARENYTAASDMAILAGVMSARQGTVSASLDARRRAQRALDTSRTQRS